MVDLDDISPSNDFSDLPYSNSNNESSELDLVRQKIISHKLKHNLTNSATQDTLTLINDVSEIRGKEKLVPSTLYKLNIDSESCANLLNVSLNLLYL